jgi:leucyl-tRNA synthetase
MRTSPPCATSSRSWACRSTGAREFATCDVDYYTQQSAVPRVPGKRSVYRKNAKVNWDPVDMTVLANEQVIDGRGWRSGALVEQRELTQWFFKITDYSEDLLEALDTLDRWPDKVRLMQKNWIGVRGPASATPSNSPHRGTGDNAGGLHHPAGHAVRRLLHGLSPDHPISASSPDQSGSRRLHRGMPPRRHLRGSHRKGGEKGLRHRLARPPSARSDSIELPVYVANFILMDYGTGAIFGCPAHDQRDLDFARKYGLPVSRWFCRRRRSPATFEIGDEAFTDDGTIFNSGFLDGMSIADRFKEAVAQKLEAITVGGARRVHAGQLPPARLGHFAPALLGLPDPGHPLRRLRRRAGKG